MTFLLLFLPLPSIPFHPKSPSPHPFFPLHTPPGHSSLHPGLPPHRLPSPTPLYQLSSSAPIAPALSPFLSHPFRSIYQNRTKAIFNESNRGLLFDLTYSDRTDDFFPTKHDRTKALCVRSCLIEHRLSAQPNRMKQRDKRRRGPRRRGEPVPEEERKQCQRGDGWKGQLVPGGAKETVPKGELVPGRGGELMLRRGAGAAGAGERSRCRKG